MKKTTTAKNSKKQDDKFKCPECGKTFQTAQGLSGHVRYLHAEPKRPAAKEQPTAKPQTKVEAPMPIASSGAHQHLQSAFAVLQEREREIEAEIARLEALKPEKESIQRELEAVKAALDVFGERESPANGNVEAEAAKGSTSLETPETVGTVEDSTPEPAAEGQPKQRSAGEKVNAPRNGKSRGTDGNAPEFTGNKTQFVQAIVRSSGSAGIAPKDIDQMFVKRRIEKSKNAIYNALDSLVRQKKVRKDEGRYFYQASD